MATEAIGMMNLFETLPVKTAFSHSGMLKYCDHSQLLMLIYNWLPRTQDASRHLTVLVAWSVIYEHLFGVHLWPVLVAWTRVWRYIHACMYILEMNKH